jgi:hypothetical protein
MACQARHITHHTEHARALVTIHALSRDLTDHTWLVNTRNITEIPLQLLDFFPLPFPIFPLQFPIVPLQFEIFKFDLVELVPSLSLVYFHESQMSTWHILLVVSTRIVYW